ncbi:MAG: efflux RND transporter periplasmic adaptor subunit [Alphaproteobacteria bacterium]|nr:efflux RND transporter periplasmic adaptor subunit [Alphaproteobacteria bacterium]
MAREGAPPNCPRERRIGGKTGMNKRRVYILLALAAALVLGACSKERSAEASANASIAPDAEAFTVEEREVPDYKPLAAVLTNRDAGAARARISGTLSKLTVREGDVVKRGEIIAVVSDQRRVLEEKAAGDDVAAAEARASKANADLKRVQELFDSGVYAEARLDDAKAAARSANAQLNAARSRRDAMKEATDQGDVLALADGRITDAPIPEGAVVMAGDIIARIATGQRVLRVELPEAEARDIHEGTEIKLTSAGHGDIAKVVQVYPAIENGQIVIDIDASKFSDEFVGIRTPVLAPIGARRAIIIPADFVTTRYGVDYVRLVRPDGAVIDAPVQLGARLPTLDGEDGVEILSGLAPGDKILPTEKPAERLSAKAMKGGS